VSALPANWLAFAGLLLNALVWGVSWFPFRQLEAAGLHPLWSTGFIYALAIPVLLIWRPRAWRAFLHQPWLWLLLLAAGLTNAGFNWAVTIGDVVRVVLLFYLMPVWSVLLAWWLLGERPQRQALLRLALALAGVIVVLKTPDSPWPLPSSLPDWLALLGGLCFALTNVLLLKLKQEPDEARMLAMFGGGSALTMGLAGAGVGLGAIASPPALQWAWAMWVLIVGLAFLFSNIGLQYGAARLSASTTALTMLTEVVFASASSVLLGASSLQPRTLLGGALILLATVWAAWPTRMRKPNAH
jgi:drug/metabolite transporter (DMT)-like permease